MGLLSTLSSLARDGAVHLEEGLDALKSEVSRRVGTQSDHLHLQPYRGFGTRERFVMTGRALRGKPLEPAEEDQGLWTNVLEAIRRFESDEIPHAPIHAEFGTVERSLTTDEEGYFDLDWRVPESQVGAEPWQKVSLTLHDPHDPDSTATATGRVLIPGEDAEFGIISDIDDTVLMTGATSLSSMARLTLLHNARTRLPFEGVAGLYRALEAGSDGARRNPLFYVSSSPWNLYDLLDDFFRHRDLPEGVILLRDLGLTEDHWLKSGHEHKRQKIERILALYPHLPFVLIGDSGQEDPEIYRSVVTAHPGRIPAIFIRDASPGTARARDVAALAEETTRTGTLMALGEDSRSAAVLAVEAGLIPAAALETVGLALELDAQRPTAAEALASAPGG